MLLIKTYIGHSAIHDIGLFADQPIQKGTIIWEFTPKFDIKLSKTKFKRWLKIDPEQALNYIYKDKNTDEYLLCSDGARFMNHSKNPNTIHMYSKNKYGQTIVVCDIKRGEEITYHFQDCDREIPAWRYRDYDNPKVIVKSTKKYAQALFAKEEIKKGEVIAKFNGRIFKAKNISDLSNDPPFLLQDHVIQFARDKWRDARGIAKFIAHSCNPNCGVKDKFFIVAMHTIKKGDELTFDYDMSEDSDWTMKCRCGSKNCRKTINGYRFLPEDIKKNYNGYVSGYLINNT